MLRLPDRGRAGTGSLFPRSVVHRLPPQRGLRDGDAGRPRPLPGPSGASRPLGPVPPEGGPLRLRAPGTPPGCPGTPRGQPLGWRAAGVGYASCFGGCVGAPGPPPRPRASLWPPHHDARVFTWIMGSVDRVLVTDPLRLFHGNAFHPNGQSLACSEPLFVPALLGLWGFLRGDPILTYNLLVLA